MKQWEKDQEYMHSCIGWMSPDGEVISCESWEHNDKAEEILGGLGYTEKDYKTRPDDFLWEHGWLKTHVVRFLGNGLSFSIHRMATEKQKAKIREIFDTITDYIDKGAGLELQAQGIVSREELAEKGFKFI